METFTLDETDRSGWPAGPWDNEPDKIVWVDEATDLDCMIVRGPSGSLCGYVGVAPSHPWHGVGYSSCLDGQCADQFCYEHSPEARVEVHGGLTYSAACRGDICHVAAAGRPDQVWWFGFDCAHCWDLSPHYMAKYPPLRDEVYRDVAYVTAEVSSLASQLAAVPS